MYQLNSIEARSAMLWQKTAQKYLKNVKLA
jgi:hypothetical protein